MRRSDTIIEMIYLLFGLLIFQALFTLLKIEIANYLGTLGEFKSLTQTH